MSEALRGVLCVKGEKGYSAYEVALQNGFIGTEADWLATLGTSSHFTEDTEIYTSTASQTVFDMPSEYTSNSFVDVYVNGMRLNSDEYSINTSTMKITLTNALGAGAKVEIVTLTMATNSLPIVATLSASSTNDEAAGAKAVYDITAAQTTSINSLNTSVGNLNTSVQGKLDSSNIQVITGNVQNIAAGATVIADVNYPSGFTQASTVIIGKMVSSNNNYYDTADDVLTASGYPMIETIALTNTNIRIWLKNTNNTQTRYGYYKITLMKVS